VGTINDHFSPSPSPGSRRGRGSGEIEIQTKLLGDRVEVKTPPDFRENLQRPTVSEVLQQTHGTSCFLTPQDIIYYLPIFPIIEDTGRRPGRFKKYEENDSGW